MSYRQNGPVASVPVQLAVQPSGQQQVIQLRLVADTREGLEQAISQMQAKFPGQLSGLVLPNRAGHRGGWLAYGNLIIGNNAPKIVRVDAATGEILD